MIIKRICFLISFVLLATSLQSANQNDTTQYKALSNLMLSTNGKWSLITEVYNSNEMQNNIYIVDNNGNISFKKKLPKKTFQLKNNFALYYQDNNTLEIINPDKKKIEIIKDIEYNSLIISNDLSIIFYLDTIDKVYNILHINEKGSVEKLWSKSKKIISFLSFSEENKMLVFKSQEEINDIILINLKQMSITTNKLPSSQILNINWDKKEPLLYIQTYKKDKKNIALTITNLKNNSAKNYFFSNQKQFIDIQAIDEENIILSTKITVDTTNNHSSNLEIYNTFNQDIPKMFSDNLSQYKERKINLILPNSLKNDSLHPLLEEQNILVLNKKNLLYYNSNQYYDYTHGYSRRIRDINLFNIHNLKKSIIVKAQSAPSSTTSLSPDGNFFIYQKNDQLYLYNINNDTIQNVLSNRVPKISLHPFENDFKIWSNNRNSFYYCDLSNFIKYDLASNEKHTVLANKGENIRYKILNKRLPHATSNYELDSHIIQDENGLLVQEYNIAQNTNSLYLITEKEKKLIINNTRDHISQVNYTNDFKVITYVLENYNKPREVYLYRDRATSKIFENTMHDSLYSWKHNIMITFFDKYGNELKGILFYPKNFNNKKKYPLVANVYEMQRTLYNKFKPLSSYENYAGFNAELLTEQGYFVFMPDIFISPEGPGQSGLHCLEESLKVVMNKEKSIDSNRLGIRGHSFGGYLVNYIITRSHLFKAAVSGAGMVDFIRSYYYYNESFSSPNYFQSENGQDKMIKPFHLDKELYLRNSPIMEIDKIETPILSYAGKNDKVVHWSQVRELFIATVRHNKQHVSLLYKNEDHLFYKKENQIDLTKRILQWFNYFLKETNTEETNWIKNNIKFEEERMTP